MTRSPDWHPHSGPGLIKTVAERLRFTAKAPVLLSTTGAPLTHTIGLIVGNISNPFYSALHRAIEDVAATYGTVVIAASLDEDATHETLLVSEFMRRNVDGIILTPALPSQKYLAGEVEAGAKIVCIDREASGISLDTVLCDNRAASEEAVLHLAAQGHRRIAYLGDVSNMWTSREREIGFLEGCFKAGISKAEIVVEDGINNETIARERTLKLMGAHNRPTALFASDNLVTIGIIRALQELALHRQVAVLGFDDFTASDLIRPAVTVIAQDPYRIGEEGAKMLFAQIQGQRTVTETMIVRTELIQRGTGEIQA